MKYSQVEFANPQLKDVDFKIKPRRVLNLIKAIFFLPLLFIIPPLAGMLIIVGLKFIGGCVVIFLLPLVSLYGVYAWVYVFRFVKRYLQSPRNKLISDGRSPVLYLYSFRSASSNNFDRLDRETPEELLAKTFEEIGPVIAVGDPNPNIGEDEDQVPFLGATRIYIDGDWQREIIKLMTISKFIVVNASNSNSVLWELKTARESVKPERLMISFLDNHDEYGVYQKSFYEKFGTNFSEIFQTPIPPYKDHLCFIGFEPDGRPYSLAIEGEYAKSLFDYWVRPSIPFVHEPSPEYRISLTKLQNTLRPMFHYYGLTSDQTKSETG